MIVVNRTKIPSDQLLPLVQWVLAHMSDAARNANLLITYKKRNGAISGVARKMAFSGGRKVRGLPQSEPLVHIYVGSGWQGLKYPITETYKERAGSMTYTCWREHFVALIAHEFRHIEQYATERDPIKRKQIFNGSLEVDAERFAMKVLAEYKKNPIEEALSNAAKGETSKRCPRCERSGPIAEMFGYRTIKGKSVIPQSYCHECRRAHARERRGV